MGKYSGADWYGFPTEVTTGGTIDQYGTNELPVDMTTPMYKWHPETAPLLAILTRLAETGAMNYRIDWMEENENPTYLEVAATEASAGTSITVVGNAKFAVLDTLLYNPRADDLRRVSAEVSSDTALTVAVNQGGKTSTVWKSGDRVYMLLPTMTENDTDGLFAASKRAVSTVDSNVYNYVMLGKLQYRITRLTDKMKTHFTGPGGKRQQLRQKKFNEFRIKLEQHLYWGGRSTSGDNSAAEMRQMGGLNHYLRDGTLFKDFNGMMTESGWRNFLLDYKDQNPDVTEVTAFVAGQVREIINGFGTEKIRISPGRDKTLGLYVDKYIGPVTVNLVTLPLLTDRETRGWGWLLDLSRIKLRWIDRPEFLPDAYNKAVSEQILDTYRCSLSMVVATESKHAMFIGADL